MKRAEKPFVSIIIPVYRNWGGLKTCLEFLARQSYPNDRFEVLVINNDPDTIPPYDIQGDNCIVYKEDMAGSYAARNTGVRYAVGEIIGFTDADCIPDVEWIERAVEWFDGNSAISRIAGRVDVITREPPERTFAEVHDLLFEFRQDVLIKRQHAGVTANMFCRHGVIEAVGPFDERYFSTGDMEWGRRAYSAGFEIAYADDVVVSHPARRSYKALLRKARRVGAGTRTHHRYEFLLAHAGMIKAFVPPLRMFGRALKSEIRLAAKLAAMSIHYHLKLVKAFARLRVAYGKEATRA